MKQVSSAKRQALGFWRGFSALFRACGALLRLKAAWPYAAVPVVVFLLLEGVFVYLAVRFVQPRIEQSLSGGGQWLDRAGWLASWFATLGVAGLGWLASLTLTPPLSAPALERVVGVVERDLKAPARAELGFVTEFWCGLRSMLISSAVTIPIIVALTLFELLAPPVAVVTTPLKLLIGALGVAWSLFDYPLTLRGVGARQRLTFMRAHLTVVVGFGTSFALVAAIPCCSVVMLPVGVVAATQLLWEIEHAATVPGAN